MPYNSLISTPQKASFFAGNERKGGNGKKKEEMGWVGQHFFFFFSRWQFKYLFMATPARHAGS